MKVGAKRKAGAVAGPAEGAGQIQQGTGGIDTASARSSAGLAVCSTPIDVDLPPSPRTQSRLLVVSKYQLADVVAAVVTPTRKDISLTRKDVKEILFLMHEVRRTVDSRGQAIDRMAGRSKNVQSRMEEVAADVKNGNPSYKTASKRDPEHAAMQQKLAMAAKNYMNMDAARPVFKDNMKDDMGPTDEITRVYPSGATSYDDSVRALKEVLGLIESEANEYALSVCKFTKRDKNSIKEARISERIVSSKS